MGEYLWYIPNTVEAGIRGDDVASGWADLEQSVTLARMTEDHGWGGALFGTSWGRPDTFTVATAIAARTTTFKPLIAIRPGYWRPAHFASAAATLDQAPRRRRRRWPRPRPTCSSSGASRSTTSPRGSTGCAA